MQSVWRDSHMPHPQHHCFLVMLNAKNRYTHTPLPQIPERKLHRLPEDLGLGALLLSHLLQPYIVLLREEMGAGQRGHNV